MEKYILLYLAVISAISVIVTLYDKRAAKKHPKHRIRERTLIFLGIIGGAVAEYFTMLLIRHKTKHTKFMVGLPIIILIHIAIVVFLFLKEIGFSLT